MLEKVVFDTNIWISAFYSGYSSNAFRCKTLVSDDKRAQLIYCREACAELSEKLRSRLGYSENQVHWVMYLIRTIGEEVEITGELRVVAADPDDDIFVECAVVGQASTVVSGDRHLLELEEYLGIQFVNAATFVARFEKH